MRSRYLIIVNPVSGNGSSLHAEGLVRRALSEKKLPFKVIRTMYKGHAIKVVSGLRKKFTDVVSIGGDGTLNEVVNGIKRAPLNVGVVPSGSGNDFLKNLDCPPDMNARISCALFGKTRRIDTGLCNGRIFVNGVGIGFDGRVVEVMGIGRAGWIPGRVRYMLTVLGLFLSYREVPMRLVMDRKLEERKLFLVTVGNGTTFGGGYKLCPDAKLDDGFFDVCLIDKLPLLRRFLKVPLTGSGRHVGLPEVRIKRCRNLKVYSDSPLPGHVDGDFTGHGPYEISLVPSSLLIRAIRPS